MINNRMYVVALVVLLQCWARVKGDCCACLAQRDPKATVLTYDATVYDQCAAAEGICCFDCGFSFGEPLYERGIMDNQYPFQAIAGQWLEISMNNVERITFDFLRPNQPKTRFVNNGSSEAEREGNVFRICPRGAGTILYRGWGASACKEATNEYTIEVVEGSEGKHGPSCLGTPTPSVEEESEPSPSPSPNRVDKLDMTNKDVIAQCSPTRGSVKQRADGSKYCECTGDWSNPPLCDNYSWTRTLLTIGGAIATVLSIAFSVRAFYMSRKASRANSETHEVLDDLRNSMSGSEVIHIQSESPSVLRGTRSPVAVGNPKAVRETTL